MAQSAGFRSEEDFIKILLVELYTSTLQPISVSVSNGEEFSVNIFSLYYEFDVKSNGTYTFTAVGPNGETGEVTIEINSISYKIKIGDYVNYTYDPVVSGYNLTKELSGYTNSSTEDGSQTISQSSKTLQWRILDIYEDESGNEMIDLVSATPTSNRVYFQGALGYNNGVYLLNDICAKLYSNKSKGITARSINLEDTEKHFTTAGLNKRNAYTNSSSNTQYGSTKTYTNSYSYYPNLYEYEIGSGVNVAEANASSITQPDKTIANLDPYKESKASPSTSFTVPTTATTETSSKTQASNRVLTVTQTAYYNIAFNDSNKYYDEAGAVLTASSYYWIASRYANCNSSDAFFGLRYGGSYMLTSGLFRSNGDAYIIDDYGLRPVVTLSSSLLSDTKDADGHWNLK